MFARSIILAAAAGLSAATFVPAAAEARGGDHDRGRHYGHYDRDHRGYDGRRYYRGGGGYYSPRYAGSGDYGRGYSGRGYRCDRGTGGTIIGAIAGGLLGNEIGNGRYNNRDGTTGAIVGAGIGALAGRSIDRDC